MLRLDIDGTQNMHNTNQNLRYKLYLHVEKTQSETTVTRNHYDINTISTGITSVKHILFILAVKFSWATCFDLV